MKKLLLCVVFVMICALTLCSCAQKPDNLALLVAKLIAVFHILQLTTATFFINGTNLWCIGHKINLFVVCFWQKPSNNVGIL